VLHTGKKGELGMSQWAGRKGQSLTVRTLWRFGPAAAIAVLLAMPSVHGGAPGHGTGHAPVPATARHIHRFPGPATVRAGTVRAGTVSSDPGQTMSPLRSHRPRHFIKPD
jgi:hypothetical protein